MAPATRLAALASALAACASAPTSITIETCAGIANQAWSFTDGALRSGSGLCLTAGALPIVDGTDLGMAPCGSGAPAAQAWVYNADNATFVSAGQPDMCVNIAGYGTAPGSQVWLWSCSATDCQGNCDWTPGNASTVHPLVNHETGLCLDDGLEPGLPQTCDPGSPSAGLPFCNYSLSQEARVADLIGRLTLQERIDLFSLPNPASAFLPALNLKSFYWDITCM
jgi:hypothetical protein